MQWCYQVLCSMSHCMTQWLDPRPTCSMILGRGTDSFARVFPAHPPPPSAAFISDWAGVHFTLASYGTQVHLTLGGLQLIIELLIRSTERTDGRAWGRSRELLCSRSMSLIGSFAVGRHGFWRHRRRSSSYRRSVCVAIADQFFWTLYPRKQWTTAAATDASGEEQHQQQAE